MDRIRRFAEHLLPGLRKGVRLTAHITHLRLNQALLLPIYWQLLTGMNHTRTHTKKKLNEGHY